MSRPAMTTGPPLGDAALRAHHRRAHLGVRGHGRNDRGDFVALQGRSSSSCPPALMRKPAEPSRSRSTSIGDAVAEPHQRRAVVHIGARSQREIGERAIHRAGIEIEDVEACAPSRARPSSSPMPPVRRWQSASAYRGSPARAASPQAKRRPRRTTANAWLRRSSVYFCSACGFESPRWLGRCPQCEAWNSFDERPFAVAPRASARDAASATQASAPRAARATSDRRARHALANGHAGVRRGARRRHRSRSLTLVGGPPGAGKSTLLLQIAARLAEQRRSRLRLRRGVGGASEAARAIARSASMAPDSARLSRKRICAPCSTNSSADAPLALIVDSIQTVWLPESEAYAGSVTQIRDCTQALMEFSKRTGCATFIVGHVTKDGAIAGPRLLEHLVDTVLYFEGESNGEYRILRAYKNRFGSIDEICVFAMHDTRSARSRESLGTFSRGTRRSAPAARASSHRSSARVRCSSKYRRSSAKPATARRAASPTTSIKQRLAMILAVLERRAGFSPRHARRLRVGCRRPAGRRTRGRSGHRSGDRFVVSQRRDAGAHRRLRRTGVIRRSPRRRRQPSGAKPRPASSVTTTLSRPRIPATSSPRSKRHWVSVLRRSLS